MVGVASNVAEALERVASLRPDVTLVDVVLGAESGFDLAERLSHGDVRSPVILTSTHSEQDLEDAIAAAPRWDSSPRSPCPPAPSAYSSTLPTADPRIDERPRRSDSGDAAEVRVSDAPDRYLNAP